MARIGLVEVKDATGRSKELLEGAQKALGMVPNMFKALANSPAALHGYLAFSQALDQSQLPAPLREQIAVAVAGANSCGYCASAHTALGAKAGVDTAELERNLRGEASDEKTAAAIRFARTLVEKRGFATDDDLAQVREAGFGDGEIAEIVAAVALNTYTNYFNHIADPEIDFPKVETPQAVAV